MGAGISTFIVSAVAICTCYVVNQQRKINEQRLFFELFDKRIKILNKIKEIMNCLIKGDEFYDYTIFEKFKIDMADAFFLFGPEVLELINKICEDGLRQIGINKEFDNLNKRFGSLDKGEKKKHGEFSKLRFIFSKWLCDEVYGKRFDPLNKLFKPYLDLSSTKKMS